MRRSLSVALVLLIAWPALAAAPTGDAIIASVKRAFSPINDYRCDVTVTVQGPQISINNMSMTLYFKKPNRMHIDAKQGFAVAPSGNFLGNPIEELSKGHATYLGTERNQGRECYVLKLSGQGVNPKLYVDKARSVIVATEDERGSKAIWRYGRVDGKYYLPSEIRAEMPNPRGGSERVKTTIRFSNYRVNKGISDKIFEENHPNPQQKTRKGTGRRDPDQ